MSQCENQNQPYPFIHIEVGWDKLPTQLNNVMFAGIKRKQQTWGEFLHVSTKPMQAPYSKSEEEHGL